MKAKVKAKMRPCKFTFASICSLSIWKDLILQITFLLPLTPWKLSQECKATLLYCMAANYEQKFFFDKKIFKLKCEVFSDANIFLQNCFWVLKVAKIVGIHIHMKYKNAQKSSYTSKPLHRGAFCQFSFRWIYY